MASGIDVLISGHPHNRLYQPLWIDSTPIIQSGCHGSFIGRLDLTDVLLDAMARAASAQLAFSNGWRYGVLILRGAVTMEHLWNIVPTAKKYGSNGQKIGIDAIQALQQLFASTLVVRGTRRGSVVVV